MTRLLAALTLLAACTATADPADTAGPEALAATKATTPGGTMDPGIPGPHLHAALAERTWGHAVAVAAHRERAEEQQRKKSEEVRDESVTRIPTRAATAAPTTGGDCSGWLDLVSAHFPGEEATACRVLACESGGNPGAVSRTDDHGLWQLNRPSWEHRFADVTGVSWSEGVYDPGLNTRFAAWLRNAEGWTQWACF